MFSKKWVGNTGSSPVSELLTRGAAVDSALCAHCAPLSLEKHVVTASLVASSPGTVSPHPSETPPHTCRGAHTRLLFGTRAGLVHADLFLSFFEEYDPLM